MKVRVTGDKLAYPAPDRLPKPGDVVKPGKRIKITEKRTCPICGGSGHIPVGFHQQKKCNGCGGTGEQEL